MRTIDITQILSTDLKSRDKAKDLKTFINNCNEETIQINFKSVQFATRSFIDEFYNLFIKNQANEKQKISLINVPNDICTMLNSVSKTQKMDNTLSTIPEITHTESFQTVEDFLEHIENVNS